MKLRFIYFFNFFFTGFFQVTTVLIGFSIPPPPLSGSQTLVLGSAISFLFFVSRASSAVRKKHKKTPAEIWTPGRPPVRSDCLVGTVNV